MFFPGVREHVPLAPYSTFRIGGPADFFYDLKDLSQLTPLLQTAQHEGLEILVIGGGSNTLFADEGFRGLVVHVAANAITIDGTTVTAEAGTLMAVLIYETVQQGLGGLLPLLGLPGTVGGAVFGNAGAHGIEFSQFLTSVRLLDPKTLKEKIVPPGYFDFSYRRSTLKKTGEHVLAVTLQLPPLDPAHSETIRAQVLAHRKEKQPAGYTGGSFFKNPPEHPAGWYIDQAGLKGLRIGDAMVSKKHANFFMNVEKATASDMLALRDRVKTAVHEKFGIVLEEEVRVIPA